MQRRQESRSRRELCGNGSQIVEKVQGGDETSQESHRFGSQLFASEKCGFVIQIGKWRPV